jgi:hypothetical protein
LPPEQLAPVAAGLAALTAKLALEQQRPVFGACDRCKHLQVDRTGAGAPQEGCGLFNMPLSSDDSAALCVCFESRGPGHN